MLVPGPLFDFLLPELAYRRFGLDFLGLRSAIMVSLLFCLLDLNRSFCRVLMDKISSLAHSYSSVNCRPRVSISASAC